MKKNNTIKEKNISTNSLRDQEFEKIYKIYIDIFGKRALWKEKVIIAFLCILWLWLIYIVNSKIVDILVILILYILGIIAIINFLYINHKKHLKNEINYLDNLEEFNCRLYEEGFSVEMLKYIVTQDKTSKVIFNTTIKAILFFVLTYLFEKILDNIPIIFIFFILLIGYFYTIFIYLSSRYDKKLCWDTIDDIIIFRYKYEEIS